MEWTISFLSDQQIVVIKTRGEADGPSSLEMVKSLSKAMAQHKAARCLIDHSDISSVSGDTPGIYYRPQRLGEMGVPTEIKIAEVVLPAHRQHFGFLKVVCQNYGFSFRMFDDRESAIEWLTK
jgi:hypothetical protein